ncbi:helix-turn-helix domain-containing protein [Mycetocola sp. JXN-3]|uniref:winged helix-turn-helix transcriptional regulator n=1 Tax=Mycetocola sp. JXN-3 TaxID=2116510 RepID=UPI00165CFE9F|nr:helix-turn-helix domain-containing protein [Mycetocola sp. JXN-3]
MATMTARQRREAERAEFEEFFEGCPSRLTLARLGDKWVAVTLITLAEGPKRRGELARAIATASQKMLTQTLRTLERDGLICRSVEATVPVTVTYALTARGHSLVEALDSVVEWATVHVPGIEADRQEYDRLSIEE